MEENKVQTSIEFTRNRSWLFAFGSFVFFVVGAYLIFNAKNLVSNGGSVEVNIMIGALMLVFFAYSLTVNLRRLINRTPAYVFAENGLIYNIKNPSSGTVLWKDITSFSRIKVKGNYFILLMLKNPEQIIDREKSGMKKRLFKMNMRTYKTPLSVAMNELQISVVDFENLLTAKLNAKKKN